jgi:hypothetical protein
MADNITIPPTGSGTATPDVATDDVGGVHYQKVKLDVGGDGASSPVTDLASGAKQDTGNTALAAIQAAAELLDDAVKADDAAFTAGTDKVIMAGGLAVAHGSAPDAADAGDAGAPLMNRHRVPFVIGGHPNVRTAVYNTTAAGTDDNVLAAIASGTKYVVTRVTAALGAAATVPVAVRLGFGASTIPALGASAADAVEGILVYHPGLVPGSGFQMGDGSGILGVGGDGEELRITNDVPTGGTLAVSVTFYTIES